MRGGFEPLGIVSNSNGWIRRSWTTVRAHPNIRNAIYQLSRVWSGSADAKRRMYDRAKRWSLISIFITEDIERDGVRGQKHEHGGSLAGISSNDTSEASMTKLSSAPLALWIYPLHLNHELRNQLFMISTHQATPRDATYGRKNCKLFKPLCH
jgi:hypothetical protein